MNKWVIYPTTLLGETVDLMPLEKEHFEALETLAKDKRIWEHYTFDGTHSETFLNIQTSAFAERDNGTRFPFFLSNKGFNKRFKVRSIFKGEFSIFEKEKNL